MTSACRAFHLQALSLFRGAAEYDSWLQNIRAPVLAIAGDKDALTPMKLGRMVIKRVRKGSSCEIPLGGHQVTLLLPVVPLAHC